MNKLPKFGGDNGKWVYDRIIPIHCTNIIPLEKQDKRLIEKLYEERESIVHKAVMAFREVIANGYRFNEPQPAKAIRKEYMANNNTVITFWEMLMIPRDGAVISNTDTCTTYCIYNVYQAQCKDYSNGYYKTFPEFREEICRYLEKRWDELITQRSKGSYFRDYTLSDEGKAHYL